MITEKRVIEIADDYAVNPMSMRALYLFAMKIFRIGAEHQLLNGWTKPSDHLPTHEQDCIICRLVDGQCRVYQSQYYAGRITKGFGDLDDGERFYDDVLYWMPVNMTDVYAEIERGLKSETCNSNKKSK
ncbi:hypothetical protein CAP50_05615 [Psychrobacter sp. L7]|uniref:hypothetical protein n=1 Tax=Psychrobacter sp. L7 TaxID=1982756 RepID=UPI000C2A0B83|nr:hypothetical protein [Psychrobacter sp. L7]PJX25030.1 hypothetical protein CAP50_05615 [Psychrobacter sp. L7]